MPGPQSNCRHMRDLSYISIWIWGSFLRLILVSLISLYGTLFTLFLIALNKSLTEDP